MKRRAHLSRLCAEVDDPGRTKASGVLASRQASGMKKGHAVRRAQMALAGKHWQRKLCRACDVFGEGEGHQAIAATCHARWRGAGWPRSGRRAGPSRGGACRSGVGKGRSGSRLEVVAGRDHCMHSRLRCPLRFIPRRSCRAKSWGGTSRRSSQSVAWPARSPLGSRMSACSPIWRVRTPLSIGSTRCRADLDHPRRRAEAGRQ